MLARQGPTQNKCAMSPGMKIEVFSIRTHQSINADAKYAPIEDRRQKICQDHKPTIPTIKVVAISAYKECIESRFE